ncbi:hypothetical protein CDAR_586671 [Caerostris darwini]|uniref:LRRCT domain-containing protein n=1 Tax=Caerostris darwini TaxID=1538125 RepID=A0AAV4TPT6_9ARAC|nr:hypothetical protein CDAR_586671 [Caerostris darwini]
MRNDELSFSHRGGVLLEDNPWVCSCELVWMGKWLRRWLRETFHVHMLSIEAMLYVNSVARKTRCSVPNTNITFAVIDLRPSDIHCQKSVGNAFYASCSVTVILLTFSLILYCFYFICVL